MFRYKNFEKKAEAGESDCLLRVDLSRGSPALTRAAAARLEWSPRLPSCQDSRPTSGLGSLGSAGSTLPPSRREMASPWIGDETGFLRRLLRWISSLFYRLSYTQAKAINCLSGSSISYSKRKDKTELSSQTEGLRYVPSPRQQHSHSNSANAGTTLDHSCLRLVYTLGHQRRQQTPSPITVPALRWTNQSASSVSITAPLQRCCNVY